MDTTLEKQNDFQDALEQTKAKQALLKRLESFQVGVSPEMLSKMFADLEQFGVFILR